MAKQQSIFERRCPHCGWYLYSARIIHMGENDKTIVEIEALCGRRECKRRDVNYVDAYKEGLAKKQAEK